MQIQNIYSGFDTLDIAFKGALSLTVLEYLEIEKERAQAAFSSVPAQVGQLEVVLSKHGRSNGYRYSFTSKEMGEIWTVKHSTDSKQWNLFVSVGSKAFACFGFNEVKRRIFEHLDQMECLVTGHSVNRIDYAMDFGMVEFEPDPHNVISHSRQTHRVISGWGNFVDETTPTEIMRGRKRETLMLGKLPNRQIVIYNKAKEIAEKNKIYWLEVWGDVPDWIKEVWRVEFRAGKRELKDRYNMLTLTDIENSIGDVFIKASQDTRYVAEHQEDRKAGDKELHPLWVEVQRCLSEGLFEHRSGLLPSDLRELDQQVAISRYQKNVIGNAAGLAAVMELEDERIVDDFPNIVSGLVEDAIADTKNPLLDKVHKVKETIRFM